MRVPQLCLVASLGVGASACVVAPTDWDRIQPSEPIAMTGYASLAGTAVRVQAKNQRTGAWDVVATYTASSTPTTINGDTLYG